MVVRSTMRVGLGIAVLLLSFPLISLSSDFAEVQVGILTNCCFSVMLATGATLLPKSSRNRSVFLRQNN